MAVAGLLAVLAGCAQTRGEPPESFEAQLTGAQEVPAVASAASGQVEVEFVPSTAMVRWRISHAGLSGPVTGAHIHGPAGPGQNAPVVIPFGSLGANPLRGEARITPEQLGQLNSGQWYVNLHTAGHPNGEIRGQLRPRR
ncbi:MAG TPA: CHRD domain-containing protein [Ramlibacter sp.]|uniref:CHRD domain-containing protein n=1 Tax=Ramlibacter sp. TaxID=1917967 RepID=UPI002ED40F67